MDISRDILYIDGLAQIGSSMFNALELLQSCSKPWIWAISVFCLFLFLFFVLSGHTFITVLYHTTHTYHHFGLGASITELIKQSQNAPVPYPTMPHSEQKCAHFCSEWNVVRYVTGADWALWNWSIDYMSQRTPRWYIHGQYSINAILITSNYTNDFTT